MSGQLVGDREGTKAPSYKQVFQQWLFAILSMHENMHFVLALL
jgi:hypothetical protein